MRGGHGLRRTIATREHVLPLDDFARASSLGPRRTELEGRSVVLFVRDMAKAAAALIDLDGCARRILLCPPGWTPAQLQIASRDAEADALVHDEGASPPIPLPAAAECRLPLQPWDTIRAASRDRRARAEKSAIRRSGGCRRKCPTAVTAPT